MAYQSNVAQADNMFKGEDKELNFIVYTEGTTDAQIRDDPSNNRQNITGYAIEWDLAQKQTGRPFLIKSIAIGGIEITTAAEGELTVTLDADDTLNIPSGTYQHTLWREDSGSKTVLSFGSFILRDPVEET